MTDDERTQVNATIKASISRQFTRQLLAVVAGSGFLGGVVGILHNPDVPQCDYRELVQWRYWAQQHPLANNPDFWSGSPLAVVATQLNEAEHE